MPDQILYKFRSWSDLIHKGWLTEQQIYFASPAQFNDPFDCAINYRYDLLSPEEKFNKYLKVIREEQPMLSDDEVKKHAEKWMGERIMERERQLELNKTIKKEFIDNGVGVLSLTKTKTPILLWSHYSDNHRGLCIGYNKKLLLEDLKNKYNTHRKIYFDIDVIYSDKYPIIIPREGIDLEEYVTVPLSTKAKFWEYENEKRILLLGGPSELTTVQSEVICDVTMGCNISEKDKIEIGEFVIKNLPHASLHESVKHDESFELVFKRVN